MDNAALHGPAEASESVKMSNPTTSPPRSPRLPRTRTDSNPVPTDSMVTVRLSDIRSTDTGAAPKLSIYTVLTKNEDPLVLESWNPSTTNSPTAESCHSSTLSRSLSLSSSRSRSNSNTSGSPTTSTCVDWEGLEKTEEQEPRDKGTDDSTALLLARLEQENNALATDPKSGLSTTRPARSNTRPPSIQHLKKLVNGPKRASLRYSQLPTPPMTELEFWAALVSDYPQTLQRLPTLTSNKIRSGIPPPLRGVVWSSITGARDKELQDQYERLAGEISPYEGLIGKDIGRSFPNVEMFRDPNGEGQRMLAKVLKAFSLYDQKIGYCQGLGFVVGPLLMHMTDAETFCVLVRLMEQYDLRSCFLPDLSGLHLRIFQFQSLLNKHLPTLAAHLDSLKVDPLYVSQWFLSFFAVTCPIPMLLRIYDVLLAEGASETLMRVALSLMRRNQKKILACKEFEDIMSLMLSRSLWDPYACNADDLVSDFVGLTGLVTRESLQTLEETFREVRREDSASQVTSLPDLQAAASRFLGRFWAGAHASTKSVNLSPGVNSSSRPHSVVRRTPSKQSMASTLNSFETDSSASTAPTERSRRSSGDSHSVRTAETALPSSHDRKMVSKEDKDLHSQIEDLLTAMNDLQREQAQFARDLQKEREEREEDQKVAKLLLEHVKSQEEELKDILGSTDSSSASKAEAGAESRGDKTIQLIMQAEQRFSVVESKRASIIQTKHQLRDDVSHWKNQFDTEAKRCHDLSRRLDEQENENSSVKDELRDARSRIQDGHREKQRLERQVQDLRSRKSSQDATNEASDTVPTNDFTRDRSPVPSSGLRELRLGRADTMRSLASQSNPTYSRRTSSLLVQPVLTTENNAPASEESLLSELVKAKTSEALARQELEEVKGKLDALRKMLGGAASSPSQRPSPIDASTTSTTKFGLVGGAAPAVTTPNESPKVTPTGNGGGGFFSGWGKRSVSNADGKS